MTRYLAIIAVSLLAAVIQVGWVSLMPGRDPVLVLPLVLVVMLVAEFRRDNALLAAVTAGLALDAVSSLPAGVNVILLVASWYAADFLFRKVFTNQSILAIFGLQATVYVFWVGNLSMIRAVRATLLGWSWSESGVLPAWWLVAFGLVVQAAVAGFLILARRMLHRSLFQGLMIRRRSERSLRL